MRNLQKTTVDTAPIDGSLAKKPAPKKRTQTNCEDVLSKAATLAGGIMVGVVPLSMICVEPSYQRYLRPKHVNEIQASWDIRKSNFLMVNFRDGKFYAMDGMHRLEAAKNLGVKELNCIIHSNLTVAEEAIIFAEQNDCTLKISVHDKFRARVVGGCLFEKEVMRLCDSYGISTDPVGQSQVGGLSALGTAVKIVQRHDIYWLNLIFRLVERIGWNTARGGYSRTVLLAAERLLISAPEKEAAIEKMISVFGREVSTPKDHIRVANAAFPRAESDTEALANYWKEKVLG